MATELRRRLADHVWLDIPNMLHRFGSMFTDPASTHEPGRFNGAAFSTVDNALYRVSLRIDPERREAPRDK